MVSQKSQKAGGIWNRVHQAAKEVCTIPQAALIAVPTAFIGVGWTIQLAGHLLCKDPHMVSLGCEVTKAGHMLAEGAIEVGTYKIADAGKDFVVAYRKRAKSRNSKRCTRTKSPSKHHGWHVHHNELETKIPATPKPANLSAPKPAKLPKTDLALARQSYG